MEQESALGVGGLVPHFTVVTPNGVRVAYSSIWQRKNLLLVCLTVADAWAKSYATALASNTAAWESEETMCVVTYDTVPGVPCPGALIADRWGEIYEVVPFETADTAPDPAELLATLAHVRMKCPECEGEAR